MPEDLREVATRAREAAVHLATAPRAVKDRALHAMADALVAATDEGRRLWSRPDPVTAA